MMLRRKLAFGAAGLVALTAVLGGCGDAQNTSVRGAGRTHSTRTNSTVSTPAPLKGTEQPVPPEQHPVGDIPDTQAFITYQSTLGKYSLEVPEGWSRFNSGSTVTFTDKLDGVRVNVTNGKPLRAKALRNNPMFTHLGRAIRVNAVSDVHLRVGDAVFITYTSNSDPNPVTGKQVRLENNAYFFYKNGKVAILTLWAPLGADNVDQWKRIFQSFRWH